jgi:hypothetical protein
VTAVRVITGRSYVGQEWVLDEYAFCAFDALE